MLSASEVDRLKTIADLLTGDQADLLRRAAKMLYGEPLSLQAVIYGPALAKRPPAQRRDMVNNKATELMLDLWRACMKNSLVMLELPHVTFTEVSTPLEIQEHGVGSIIIRATIMVRGA